VLAFFRFGDGIEAARLHLWDGCFSGDGAGGKSRPD
jgi:hypothetical protein